MVIGYGGRSTCGSAYFVSPDAILASVLLKSLRNNIIYQRPSFANGPFVLAATFPTISHRTFDKSGKSMLRRRYSTRKYLFILFLLISHDIQLNPGPLNSSILKSCSLNSRSIVNKRTELQAMVATKELDIIAVTETCMVEPWYNGSRNPVTWL